jgi:AraC family transcriptional regulator
VKPKGPVDEPFGRLKIEEGLYVIAHCHIRTLQEARDAWQYLYGTWMTNSGYEPGHGEIFEMYLNDPSQSSDNLQLINLYLPIKK